MAAGDLKHVTQRFLMGTNAMQIGLDVILADNTGTNGTLAADWMAGFAGIAALLSAELSNNGVLVADISATPQVTITLMPSGGDWTVGGDADTSVPSASAATITKYTAIRGKRGRGRVFLPGIPEAQQDQGLLDLTFQANLQTAVDAFLLAISSATASGNVYTPSVFSYLGVAPGPNRVPSDVNAITFLTAQRTMRQQRRREVGVSRRGRRKAA